MILKLLAWKHLLLGLGIVWLLMAIGWIWPRADGEPIVGLWMGFELSPVGKERRVRFEAHPGGTFRIASASGKTRTGAWKPAEGWHWRDGSIWILSRDMVENYPYWRELRAKDRLIQLPHVYELIMDGESKLVAVAPEQGLLQMGDGNWRRAKPLLAWLREAATAVAKGEEVPPRDSSSYSELHFNRTLKH